MHARNGLLAAMIATLTTAAASAQDAHQHGVTTDAPPPPPAAAAPPAPVAQPPGGEHTMGMMGPGTGCAMMGDRGMREMQGHGRPGQPHGMAAMDGGPTDPVEGAFAAINRRMHEAMAAYTPGDPDRTFAEAMVAHHQGAVDMAKVALAFGSDPEIRKLAEQVIKAQEQEITFLRQWLAARPQR